MRKGFHPPQLQVCQKQTVCVSAALLAVMACAKTRQVRKGDAGTHQHLLPPLHHRHRPKGHGLTLTCLPVARHHRHGILHPSCRHKNPKVSTHLALPRTTVLVIQPRGTHVDLSVGARPRCAQALATRNDSLPRGASSATREAISPDDPWALGQLPSNPALKTNHVSGAMFHLPNLSRTWMRRKLQSPNGDGTC